jgi:hypothetical protein
MSIHMFADENERRRHVETKHRRCGYCYQSDLSIEHIMKEHPSRCIWWHEKGLYAPVLTGATHEVIHMKKYHPRPQKILA